MFPLKKRRLTSIVCIVILNLFIQPMYAEDTFLLSEELSGQNHTRDTSYQEESHQEASTVFTESESWMPAFIKKTASYVSSKASALTRLWDESYKYELFCDPRKQAYDAGDFEGDIDDIVTSGAYDKLRYKLLRLRELQDHVWKGEISPYTYDQGLKDLEPYIPKALLSQVREEFEGKVKSFPVFINNNFQRDLKTSLEDISTSLEDISEGSSPDPPLVDFKELLTYYRTLQNPFDYANTLDSFAKSAKRDYAHLSLKEDQWGAWRLIIEEKLEHIDAKKYRKIEAEQRFIQSALKELPYYGESLPKGFNSSLPPRVTQQTSDTQETHFSFMSAFTGLAYNFAKGIKYAVKHPGRALALGLAGQVMASEFPINQITTGDQAYPSVVGLTNGNVFVTWDGTQTGRDIYGRVFLPNETPLGNEFRINQNTTGIQRAPSVAVLTNGNVLVAWQSYQVVDQDIYGRILLPDGTVLDSDFLINQITTGFQYEPSVAGLSNGNAFVAWAGRQTGNYDIYARVILPNGTALGNEFIINQITTGNQRYPSVVGLTNGDVFVAWEGTQAGSGDIYGRVFLSNGTAFGNEFQINQNTTGFQIEPSVTCLSNGNAFVVWPGDQTGNGDIYGRILLPNGTALGNEFVINQITTRTQFRSSVADLPNGNMFVAWEDIQPEKEIHGRILLPNGTALGDEFPINQNTTGSQESPSVAGLSNGNAFVAWARQTGNYDIYGRILSSPSLIAPSPSPASTNPSLTATLTSGGSGTSLTLPASQIASTNPSLTATLTSGGAGTSLTPPMSQMASTNSIPAFSLSMASSSLASMLATPAISSLLPAQSSIETVPFETSDSSTGFSGGTSGQTTAVIGGAVGGSVVVAAVGGVIAKKCCFSKGKRLGKSDSTDSDVELAQKSETSSPEHEEIPASREKRETTDPRRLLSAFAPTSARFGQGRHPDFFVGTILNMTYEIWKELYRREAELLRPLTAMTVPEVPPGQAVSFTLGAGSFATTYVGRNLETQEIYAIKEVRGAKAVEESLREGEIVHSLGSHPNIMPLVDYMYFKPDFDPDGTYIESRLLQVMPLAYINGVRFKEMLASLNNNNQRGRIASDAGRQLMMGLDYMHNQGVVHRDIKDDNLLFEKDGTLRIADYGRAIEVGENDQIGDYKGFGAIRTWPPEIFALIRKRFGGTDQTVESVSGKAADVWAAGLYIWELLENEPSNVLRLKSLLERQMAVNYTYEYFENAVRSINLLDGKFSPSLIRLLRGILTVDPHGRLQSPYVIEILSASVMTPDERKLAFEQLINLATENKTAANEPASYPVYQGADPAEYLKEPNNEQQPAAYLPNDLYPTD